jgi:microcystin-dependent protein
MTDQYLGEIRLAGFNFAPQGWAVCNGQLLPINQNQALFSLLGTQYGGNGVTTFALPNLQARMALHQSASYPMGQLGGEVGHTLVLSELAAHTHPLSGTAASGSLSSPANAVQAATVKPGYGTTQDTPFAAAAVSQVGQSQPHENLSPYLVMNYVIALVGIFPSQN